MDWNADVRLGKAFQRISRRVADAGTRELFSDSFVMSRAGMRHFGILILLLLAAVPLRAETLQFEGRIEAAREAVLSSQLDGVVAEILFDSGDRVEKGAPLIVLDPAEARLSVAVAEANLSIAQSQLEGAQREADRQETLSERGIAADTVLDVARTERKRAEAEVALAQAELGQARLRLDRTLIRAPITGYVGPPLVDTGAFLEAESGAPLAKIVGLDPVIVSYRVPYAMRLASIQRTGQTLPADMFDQILLRFELPGGLPYDHTTRPDHAAAVVDPEDGTITVRAYLPNPDRILRPGMAVTVFADIAASESQ